MKFAGRDGGGLVVVVVVRVVVVVVVMTGVDIFDENPIRRNFGSSN